ncbi:MAG: hypothetical protein WEB94_00730 [Candidatus Paceibacterota bacterium]
MAHQVDGPRITKEAGADLSSSQYLIVKLNSSGKAVLASAATDVLLGTLNNKPVSGQGAEIQHRAGGGTGKVKLGGSVEVNDQLTSNGDGEAIKTTISDNEVVGFAMEDGADGQVIEYLPSNRQVA